MGAIVYLSQEQYDNYWKEIEASNLPKTMKWDLRDLLGLCESILKWHGKWVGYTSPLQEVRIIGL